MQQAGQLGLRAIGPFMRCGVAVPAAWCRPDRQFPPGVGSFLPQRPNPEEPGPKEPGPKEKGPQRKRPPLWREAAVRNVSAVTDEGGWDQRRVFSAAEVRGPLGGGE